MFANRILRLSTVFAAACAAAAAAAEPAGIKLPGAVSQGVVKGDHFFAVTNAGGLIDVDLKLQKVRDLSTLDAKLKPFVDVLNGKACVAADGRILVVDLAEGKAVGSAEFKGEVAGLGFINADRVYVRSPRSVTVLDVAAGKTVQTIDFGAAETDKFNWHLTQHLSGERLYAAHAGEGALTVIDLARGEAITSLKTPEWRLGGVWVDRGYAYVLGVKLGYGVWTNSFGRFDLKTGQYTAMNLPSRMMQQPALSAGPDGTMLLHGLNGVIQLDTNGKVLATLEKHLDFRNLVGTWNGQLVFAREDLRMVPLTPATSAAAKN